MVCGPAATGSGVVESLETARFGLRSGRGGGPAASTLTLAAAVRLVLAGKCRALAVAIAGAKHANSTSNDKACALKRFISSNGTRYDPGKGGQDVPRAGEPRRRGHCIVS